MLQPQARKSPELVGLLADEFMEFGSSGRVYTKAELAAVLQAEAPSVRTIRDLQVWLLAPEAALLTYVTRREASPPVETLRSSVWQLRDGRWRMLFHQGTVTSLRPDRAHELRP